MDYEKLYKDLVEKFDAVLNLNTVKESGTISTDDVRKIIPELKDSKGDRIRKTLINMFKGYHIDKVGDFTDKEILAWLEKQGETDMKSYKTAEDEKREFVGDGFIKCYADFQDFKEGKTYWLEYVGNDNYNVRSDNLLGKTYHITPCQLYTVFKKQTWLEKLGEQTPVDKVELKFKVGDWCVFKNNLGKPFCITEIRSQYYLTNCCSFVKFSEEDNYRLWKIRDAKPGDVLVDEHATILFRRIGNERWPDVIDFYGIIKTNNTFEVQINEEYWSTLRTSNLKPATKEERDFFFQKMEDAGYRWDSEKLELKKIEQESALNEEDAEMYHRIVRFIPQHLTAESYKQYINWLKSKIFNYKDKLNISDEELNQLEYAASRLHSNALVSLHSKLINL